MIHSILHPKSVYKRLVTDLRSRPFDFRLVSRVKRCETRQTNEHFYHLRLWQINEGYGVFVKCSWCDIKVFGSFKWRTLYQAVSDVQLVKQRKMVKKRDRRGRATNEGGFYHYAFLVRKK